jgi:uncharacterized protein (TIGR02246 family)
MKKIFVVLSILSAASLSVHAETPFVHPHAETHTSQNCVKTNETEIAALFDRWNAALATLNPENVTSLYAHDAVLLATLSNEVRPTHEKIEDYFVHFLEKKPQGTIDDRLISIGCNTASDTGLYTFTLHEKNGKTQKVSARYSFVYEYDDDQWLIEHHHSSLMPEKFKKQKSH